MNSVELLDKKECIKKVVNTILDTAKQEIRMLTDEEQTKINEYKESILSINDELRKLDVELPQEETNKQIKTKTMEQRNFSLVQAIRNVANNKPQDEFTQEVLNAGVENFRMTGNAFQGQIQLPSAEFRTVTKATEGADIVATDLFDIAEAITSRSVMAQLGCRIITGLTNDVQFPVISTVNCAWESEIATHSPDTPTFTSVKLSPKRISCVVPVSKMLLAQDSVGIERSIRNEIAKAVMGKLEGTIFGNAAGTTTQPAGIFYSASTLTQVTSFADLCSMEATLDGLSGYGERKYLLSPTAKAAFRGMIKGTNATGMVYEYGEMDGTPAYTTAFATAGDLAFGDWSNLIIGIWDGLDIVVDNFSLAADGCVRLVCNFYCDANLLRAGSIAVRSI